MSIQSIKFKDTNRADALLLKNNNSPSSRGELTVMNSLVSKINLCLEIITFSVGSIFAIFSKKAHTIYKSFSKMNSDAVCTTGVKTLGVFQDAAIPSFRSSTRKEIADVERMGKERLFYSQLNQWEQEDPENRREAKARILDSFKNSSSELDLSELSITSLPDCIRNLKSLTSLNLSFTPLQTLPESFGNLKSLTSLNLSATSLQTLPESFGNLKSLTSLTLIGTPLQTLPKSFGKLTALTLLNLTGSSLQSLPESFGNLKSLTSLGLTSSSLQSLPESFGNLKSLTSLHLSGTRLQSLPESFGNLKSLTSLNLSGTQLQALPEFLRNLTVLTLLQLSYSQIQSLPDSILTLNRTLRIDLRGCPLSQTVLTRLRETTTAENYRGPQFLYNMPTNYAPSSSRFSLEDSFKYTYQSANLTQEPLPNLLAIKEPFKGNLTIWLNRLKETADGGSRTTSKKKREFL